MRGLCAIGVLLLLIAGLYIAYDYTQTRGRDSSIEADEAALLDSFASALRADSIAQREAWKARYAHTREAYGAHRGAYAPHHQRRVAETFPFDPNKCDSLTFVRLGLLPWQAHNALQYRRKGGVWRSAAHFGQLYGLDPDDFHRLSPYIRIDSTLVRRSSSTSATAHASNATASGTHATYPRVEKYAPGSIVLDLNQCDTTQLQGIPEIGSYRAAQIVKYRQALGGFVSLSQLREIPNLPPGIEQWFSVDKDSAPQLLNLNKATFQELQRHPYISYEQAREVLNYRRRYGKLSSLNDLRLSPHFSPSDLQRLQPYVDF